MGKSNLGQKRHETKDKVVTMPRTDGGEDAEAGADSDEKATAEKPGEGKATVKENKEQIAGSLVTRTVGGDMHCAAMMVSLMEKKKDGEDDDDWDGPGLADILVPSQLWRGKAAAKQTENGEEEETEAA
jgi:hypothetical protein